MKKTTNLLIALGLVSSAVLAQTQMPSDSSVQPRTGPGASGTQSGMPPQPGSDASGASPSMPSPIGPGSGASGNSGTQPESPTLSAPSAGAQPYPGAGTARMQSGPRSGMPPHPSSGTSAPPSSPSSPSSGTSGTSGTQAPMPSSPGAASSMPQLQAKTENGVSYLCGGVGQEEASYMKREARKHDVMLTFAARDGTYLADVKVAIADANGKSLLQTTCDGPMMLVDMPRNGTYKIRAEANGYELDRTVSVKQSGQGGRVATAVMTWPQQVAEGPTGAGNSSGASGGAVNAGQGSQGK
jgi:hypothetical protein